MPSKNPIAAVGSVRNFMNLIKEVNFDDIRDRAETAPRVMVVARSESLAVRAARDVFGEESDGLIELRTGDRVGGVDTSRYDAIIVSDPDGTNLLDEVVRASTGSYGSRIHALAAQGDGPSKLRLVLAMAEPDLAPSYGRWFPVMRSACVQAIIDETSKANAKFALIASAPSVVPILGSFLSAGADMLVLTKNQVMMAYKLAATNGRDLHDQTGILTELAPVVGGGFVWRTVAREAVGFLPFMAGVLPKVGIAYAGTYATGRAVDYYYRFGQKPTKLQLKEFTQHALEMAEKLPLPGKDLADRKADLAESTPDKTTDA